MPKLEQESLRAASGVNENYGTPETPNFFQRLYDFFVSIFERGGSLANTDYFNNATNANGVCPYTGRKRIRRGIIQNLSSTDELTVIFVSNGNGKVAAGATAGQATVLNRAPQAGQSGDSMVVGNVDLQNLTVITNNNTGQAYSVYCEY